MRFLDAAFIALMVVLVGSFVINGGCQVKVTIHNAEHSQ